jgi:hypothetical protein
MASPRPVGTGKVDAPATGKPAPAPPRSRSVEGGGTAYERFDRSVPKRVD